MSQWKEIKLYLILLGGYIEGHEGEWEWVEGHSWENIIGVFETRKERDAVYCQLTPEVLGKYAVAYDSGLHNKSKGSVAVLKKNNTWSLAPDSPYRCCGGRISATDWEDFCRYCLGADHGQTIPYLLMESR